MGMPSAATKIVGVLVEAIEWHYLRYRELNCSARIPA